MEPSPDAIEQVPPARSPTRSISPPPRTRRCCCPTVPRSLGSRPCSPTSPGYSDQHADQLGGVYVSGLPEPTGSPSATAPTAAQSVAEVLEDLAAATRTALADADAVADGPLARLVASIAASRGELTARLARATGVEVSLAGADEAAAPADPSPSPTTSPTAVSAGVDGLTTDQVGTLALVHDQAGYGFEVLAAKLSGDQRAAARESARSHRAASEAWAAAAGIDGSAQDPDGRPTHCPPGSRTRPSPAPWPARWRPRWRTRTPYAVAQAQPAARSSLIDGLRRATDSAAAWGATPVPFRASGARPAADGLTLRRSAARPPGADAVGRLPDGHLLGGAADARPHLDHALREPPATTTTSGTPSSSASANFTPGETLPGRSS